MTAVGTTSRTRAQRIEADLTWTGSAFERGVGVEVDSSGRIVAVGRLEQPPTLRLRRRALLPGFVNAHSHAFQRGLRGRGERFPRGVETFWTWREAMYELMERLDEKSFLQWTVQAFREMRAKGITTVGEFHYAHHASPVEADYALDELVFRAASTAGVRLCLLQAYYAHGGPGQPLAGAQRRFRSESLDAYWRSLERARSLARLQGASVGAVAHSLRAASPEELVEIAAEARRQGLVLHLHVEEQVREVEDVRAMWNHGPMRLLLDRLPRDLEGVVAVHCTQTSPADLAEFLERGGRVCLIPLTEANLGDGVPNLDPARERPGRLCLGTDSNARISLLEEARWLEYGQRLRRRERGALRASGSDAVAPALLHALTRGGAEALGVETGAIEVGRWADFIAVDLESSALTGFDPETLAETLLLGADEEVFAATAVGGLWQDTPQARSQE